MAMLRHRAAHGSAVEARLLVSTGRVADLLYARELAELADGPGLEVHHAVTRERPAGWTGFDRRVDAAMLTAVGPPPEARPRIFVCGSTPFVESVATALVGVGHPPAAVRTERFGPTGS
jgi:ferredoxin-NADP reductase